MSDYKGNFVTRIQWAKSKEPRITLYGTDGVVDIFTDSVAVIFGITIQSAFEAAVTEQRRLAGELARIEAEQAAKEAS